MPVKISKILIIIAMLMHSFSAFSSAPIVTDGEDIGLVIVGTITNSNVKDSVALVKETAKGKVKAVKEGFKVLDGYNIIQVQQKYIVVGKDTKNYVVYYNRFGSEFARMRNSGPGTSSKVALGDSYSEDGFERKGGSIKLSASYRDNMLVPQNLQKVLMQAAALPEIQNGKIVGFRFSHIEDDSLYAKAGVQNGDVFTHLNGTPLNNAASAIKLLNSLKNEPDFELEFLRNGVAQKMQLRVQ